MLKELKGKKEYKRIVGVDTSTNSFAYALVEGDNLLEHGEFVFEGDTLEAKMAAAREAAKKICDLKPDYVLVEQVIYLNNRAVVIKLAYFAGIMLSEMAARGIPFSDVVPITWQKAIGNPPFSKKERAALKKEFSDKSANWVKNRVREERKQRTIDIIKDRFGVEVDNDNIADAVGIAIYAQES